MKSYILKLNSKSFLIGIFCLGAILLSGCQSQKAMPGGVNFNSLNLNETKVVETFKTAKQNGKNVLVIFDATWCGVCREFNQKTMKDSQVVKSLKDYEVVNVDVDKFPEIAKAFGRRAGKSRIDGVPTVMIFSSEGLQLDEFVGAYDGSGFDRILKRNL